MIMFLALPALMFAFSTLALDYTVLEPLPNIGTKQTVAGKEVTVVKNLEEYLPGVIRLLIGVAGVLAVAMIVWGGLQIMLSEAFTSKEDGKKRIREALYGLIFALGSWLLLSTINPALIETSELAIKPVGETAGLYTMANIRARFAALAVKNEDTNKTNAARMEGVRAQAQREFDEIHGQCYKEQEPGIADLCVKEHQAELDSLLDIMKKNSPSKQLAELNRAKLKGVTDDARLLAGGITATELNLAMDRADDLHRLYFGQDGVVKKVHDSKLDDSDVKEAGRLVGEGYVRLASIVKSDSVQALQIFDKKYTDVEGEIKLQEVVSILNTANAKFVQYKQEIKDNTVLDQQSKNQLKGTVDTLAREVVSMCIRAVSDATLILPSNRCDSFGTSAFKL